MKLRRIITSAAVALLATSASASFISIDSIPSVFLEDGQVTAVISLQNLGDEPAYDLRARVRCGPAESFSAVLPKLPAGSSETLKAALGPAPEPGGIYTVVYTVSYKDSGGKTFSALNTISLVTDLDSPPERTVNLTVKNAELEKHAGISADIVAGEDINRTGISIFLPDEFSCSEKVLELDLKKEAKVPVSFSIRNLSANPGSTYLALLVTDYIRDGMHVSQATPFNIKVSSGAAAKPLAPFLFVLLALLIACGTAFQVPSVRALLPFKEGRLENAVIITACLLALEAYLLYNLGPKYLLMDTTTVGGDTPAHNYIASHLRDSLFRHGRIVSWAGGWWCGFPMLQFYFSLPYLCMVLLDVVLPFNIAFKLVSVAGILCLAPAAWAAGRMMKLPSPIPAVLALSTIPVLFDHSHVMWGLNIYSTLAGMISNSLSFPLMLLFIASAWRDSEDLRFRLLTVLLLAAVLASHFFTSIIGIITAAAIPFLRKPGDIMKSALILACEIGLALALMAWWLVPLVLKTEYTADFGVNWPGIDFFRQLPPLARWLSPLLVPAFVMMGTRKARAVIVLIWMLAASLFFFFYGFGISSVFVNVRLWPFIVCALIFLEAIGLGYLLSLLPAGRWLLPACAAAVLMFAVDTPNHVSAWAKWNFEGLESKEHYDVFRKLVIPLEGTPGRLANDLCDENNMLGSSRIFELAPHLAKKPVLEGGIVNSAAGSMFSYYIQSETSENCAGFPTNLKPTTFNITNATRHLELFNVKHFIARWETTRQAMRDHKDWRFVGREDEWELFELMSHDGSCVFVPDYMPLAVETKLGLMDWKSAGLEWIYNIASIDHHFVILPEGAPVPGGIAAISAESYISTMRSRDRGMITALPAGPLPKAAIEVVEQSDYAIEFKTSSPGIPHIIKMTWYPNWKAETGEQVHMITPCFMMVIPKNTTVRLVYGRTGADIAGLSVSSAGLILLLALPLKSALNRRRTSSKRQE